MITSSLDTQALENKLRIFASGLGNIYKELLSDVGEKMAAEARSLAPRRTGKLANSINFQFIDDTTGVLSTRKRMGKSNAWYALFVEKGTRIEAKKADYLMFKINGEWKKVKSSGQTAKPFFYPVADSYFGDGGKGFKALADALQRKMEQEISN